VTFMPEDNRDKNSQNLQRYTLTCSQINTSNNLYSSLAETTKLIAHCAFNKVKNIGIFLHKFINIKFIKTIRYHDHSNSFCHISVRGKAAGA
jgi:hypothetical protein